MSAPDDKGRALFSLPGTPNAPLPYLAYTATTFMGCVRYLRAAAHLGHFVHRARTDLAVVGASTLVAFAHHFPRCRCPVSNGDSTGYHDYFGAKLFQRYLTQLGVCRDSEVTVDGVDDPFRYIAVGASPLFACMHAMPQISSGINGIHERIPFTPWVRERVAAANHTDTDAHAARVHSVATKPGFPSRGDVVQRDIPHLDARPTP